MNTERTEKFVNAIACDLEEGGFRQVSGTMLRRTLATAVSAALPLLHPAELAEQQGDGITAEWVLGYFDTDLPERSREAVRDAFAEYQALAARQPGDK